VSSVVKSNLCIS